MLSHLFSAFNSLDGLMAPFLFDLVRSCLYGAINGAGALVLYAVASNQTRIKALKSESRRLRDQLRDQTLSYRAMVQVSKKNLVVSLRLLGYVLWPCLFSSVLPVVFMVWMSTYHSYTLPPAGTAIGLTLMPATAEVVIKPFRMDRNFGNGQRGIAVEAGQKMWFGIEGKTIYEGVITEPPVGSIHKKRWWNALMANDTGYIRSDAVVDEIIFAFPRKRFLTVGPAWLTTWEFPFILSCFLSAVTTKWLFKIE